MNRIRIKNLRSLRDTGEISIKKINILVGSNSSGKSTFLRVFPLLKQSFNKKINGPILWCGDDDDYVDFGSFQEALSYNAENKCISLKFDVNIDYLMDDFRYNKRTDKNMTLRTNVEFFIRSSENNSRDYISKMQYCIENQDVWISFKEDGTINKINLNKKDIEINGSKESFYFGFYDSNIFDIVLYPIREYAVEKLKTICLLSLDEIRNSRILEEITTYIMNKKIFKGKIKRKYNEKVMDKIREIYSKNDSELIEQWVYLYNLPRYFSLLSNYIKEYFRKVYYIAPVRATAERYYRLRNAAVNEVDCRGKNLPVFLNSLSNESFLQFRKWTKEHLGFEVVKSTSEGHVSLKIRKEGQEKAVNLSDTGFGYSQILPIVTQIWYISKLEAQRKHRRYYHGYYVPTTIVIEQPELHLHPALQAKLIDIIVKETEVGDINFIIETHSETMVNRVGNSIAKKQINNNDVGVIIFEKDFGEDDTTIKIGGYDDEGYLENWPIGFFEPGME